MKFPQLIGWLLMAMLCFGCDSETAQESNGLEEVMVVPTDAPTASENTGLPRTTASTEVINFRSLQDLLPESFAGLPRTDLSGETAGALGMKVSTANATYDNDEMSLEVSITDVAGASMLLSSMVNWMDIEIDRESDTEIERTMMIDGQKYFYSYKIPRQEVELATVVADRFIVKLDGSGVTRQEAKNLVKKLPLNALKRLVQ